MTDGARVVVDLATGVDAALAAFVHLEARLADEARYDEWEALWADDARYWVPRREGADTEREVSYILDNRRRLASRIAQLKTGARHAQTPPSSMRRLITNLEVTDRDDSTVTVGSNFALFEHRYTTTVWAGRYLHRIRTSEPDLRLVEKTVHLVNAADALPTMAFLI
ncbi:MAG: aromatic-ring-hydroxylating dioxygenase subunit beta [Acidimicrobiales bacterium]